MLTSQLSLRAVVGRLAWRRRGCRVGDGGVLSWLLGFCRRLLLFGRRSW